MNTKPSILDKCEEHFTKLNKISSHINTTNTVAYYSALIDITDEWRETYKTSPLFAYRWLFYIGDIHNGLGNTYMNIFDEILALISEEYIDDLKIITETGIIERYASWNSLIKLISLREDCYFNRCNHYVINHLKNYIINYMIHNDSNNVETSTLGIALPSLDTDDDYELEYAKLISSELGVDNETYMHLIEMLNRNTQYDVYYEFKYDNAAALIASNLYLNVDDIVHKILG